jgi:dTDP-4-amino-4,6-dideoxygalactose transaminase
VKFMIPINRPDIGQEEADAVLKVLKSGVITDKSGAGPRATELEANFARYVGAKHAIAVTSGTAALHAALLAAGAKTGDEVVIPAFTFHATAEAVRLTGATPTFADINPTTYTVTAETVKAAITSRTKAIMPVHLYGMPADLSELQELAREHGLVLVEDAAQAHGAEYKGSMIGSIGDMTCFSFYASKNMTTGEGGLVTTNHDEYAEQLRMLRTHGEQRPYWPVAIGNNYHLDEMRAALGCVQLKRLPGFLQKRRGNAKLLTSRLATLNRIDCPQEPADRKSAWNLYTIRLRSRSVQERNALVTKLHEAGVGAATYYEAPIHKMPIYLQTPQPRLPETDRACDQVFSIPVHQNVSQQELELEVREIERALSANPKAAS